MNSKEIVETPKKISTLYIVMCALFTALVFTATFFLNIPASVILGAGGNINLGDSVIFIASVVLGPVGGMIAGGLGASVADIAGGYMIYAPFTLVIKGLAGFICGFFYKVILKNNKPFLKRLLSMILAVIVIITGYFFAEMIILAIAGANEFLVLLTKSLITLIPNLLQTSISLLIAFIALPRIPEIPIRQV